MNNWLSNLPPPFLITAGLIYIGSLLQVGYFRSLGIEFISTISANEWALSLMVLAGPILGFGYLIVAAAKWIGRILERLFGSERLHWAFGRMPTWYWCVVIVCFIAVAKQHMPFFGIFWFCIDLITTLGLTALVVSSWESDEDFTLSTCLLLALMWGVSAISIGQQYGVAAGRVCIFTLANNRELRVVYMRSVADSHLVRLAGATYMFSKSEVKEIKCPWDDDNLDARIRLLKGK